MKNDTARANLTPGRVDAFTTDKAQAFLWDTDVSGLAVRATIGGTRAYIFQAKLNGKDLRVTIGDSRAWTVDGARKEARRLQTVIDGGTDPREQKRAHLAAQEKAKQDRIAAEEAARQEKQRVEVTVRQAWDAYLEARKPRWSERSYLDHVVVAREGGEAKKRGTGEIEPGPLASLMPLKLNDLTPETVTTWLQAENIRRPTRAALAYRLLRAFIRWSAGTKEFQESTHVEAVGSKVAKDNLRRVHAKEGDCLQREQLHAWFKAVRELGNPVQSAYLQCLLLTGTRREELAALKWVDVEFQWKSLSIADKVEENGRIIPLTPYVASLINALPRRNAWVFSAPAAALGRIKEPAPAHVRALAVAGLPHVSLHGLRRSFGTLSEWIECPVGVVAQIMGHKPSAIAEKHYRRRPLDLLRSWHCKIEAWILNEAGIEQPEAEKAGLRLVKAA
jgi:integrase